MLSPVEVDLEAYDISRVSGFLPDKCPLRKLPDPYYVPWERLTAHLEPLIRAKRLQHELDQMPVLGITRLTSQPMRRRAYVLLSFLAQAYLWGEDIPNTTLPQAIAKPLTEVSTLLEIKPFATFAAFCLWSFSVHFDDDIGGDCHKFLDNMSMTCSFTGTTDEAWFFNVSTAIEARGGRIIPSILNAISAVQNNDMLTVEGFLLDFTICLRDLCDLIDRMHENCRPSVFYHRIRPFLSGTSNNNPATENSKGVFYVQAEDGTGEWHRYSGGSNAQSSLIQLFDITLGINHDIGYKTRYLREMRSYMPAQHRRFLARMEEISNLRPYALSHGPGSSNMCSLYNSAVLGLKNLRDKHMALVFRYIIIPRAKEKAGNGLAIRQKDLVGTGGTDMIPFLRETRDDTMNAVHLPYS
ncbi:hypothetical protein FE257_001450 [Aspergillus nanangensis]|uniref:Indoleamine 2,3-dioxygenase nanC n=2 Tax=Aspergillus nanangensis TaxID=2582783 RepID=NANC_ASPNN|nr:RecName: Full=Indoleamine 2,3-dioxygenase nanC; Short=IDO nanC; AltName: Full=Nanangelenin A biosynthesis cluster protein C [Aspergillus nanangensis]KAF9884565.1 hypothetical protein FE257_001450 [Aspergillus nanangensis]QIQ51363.1 hypothetical protein FE257_001450 [Aspergillus nanangensis]